MRVRNIGEPVNQYRFGYCHGRANSAGRKNRPTFKDHHADPSKTALTLGHFPLQSVAVTKEVLDCLILAVVQLQYDVRTKGDVEMESKRMKPCTKSLTLHHDVQPLMADCCCL